MYVRSWVISRDFNLNIMKKEYILLIILLFFGISLIFTQIKLNNTETSKPISICDELTKNNSNLYKTQDFIFINNKKYSYYGTLLNCELKK